ncbi:COMM domain-containing protein 1 [Crotalus adamanteus]|uniref:COMM domain-containing protein 1 n=1 Tax=Crotalus adamanteus TaxID=8729 RepID=A0AAW1C9C3_CROAD
MEMDSFPPSWNLHHQRFPADPKLPECVGSSWRRKDLLAVAQTGAENDVSYRSSWASSNKMAASAEHPLPEPTKPLLGLLNGIAQSTFYGNTEITEELLREQLYPETSSQEFGVLLAKMKGIIKVTEAWLAGWPEWGRAVQSGGSKAGGGGERGWSGSWVRNHTIKSLPSPHFSKADELSTLSLHFKVGARERASWLRAVSDARSNPGFG